MNLPTLEQTPYITIYYDEENGWLYNQWRGEQTQKTVVTGANFVLTHAKRLGLRKLLNDNSLLTTPWQGAAAWVEKEFLPRAAEAGIEAIAWVAPPEYFNELSARLQLLGLERPVIFPFEQAALAMAWLRDV
ncbi:hypothetical protein FY528_09895 [Hymenobacter lutimineralis]|uniref:STAS/SEC14 domain-containing protein n=1 Tax=Hymenobacter lutimineralis TaxID=2606448 RepID=A0A5D6V2L7_9BACT|nr:MULTISPECIES: hypothetical protein [Hymenobacter]QIX60910.1 hypothetical protein HER32_06840 [Hymenobacter sp. BT18]TYZ09547.1 hypothetical protein FY528_09895 [Hymenobacter lutimineralis]